MVTKKSKEKTEKEIPVRDIEWYFPENLTTKFATNMAVQKLENEFKVSFFELMRPIILTPDDPKLKTIKSVRANCVASIIITADRLPKFIEVLQEQLRRYNSSKKAEKS